jgi:hypothetical protein
MTVPRRGVALVLGLVLVAGVSAALAVVLWPSSAGDVPGDAVPTVAAEGLLEPRVLLFGDTVRATVVAAVDPRAVDPGSVRVSRSSFLPFRPAGEPTRTVRQGRDTTVVETAFVLRCLSSDCVPGTSTMEVEPRPARLEFSTRAGGDEAVEVGWPKLVVYTRVDPRALSGQDPLAAPWRADAVTLPAVSYRVPPRLLAGLFLAAGALLLAAGAVLAYRMRPRRPPPPPPAPPPEPEISAIERALAVLESPDPVDGVGDRRRALELIAEEAEGWSDRDLTEAARSLAWSERDPAPDAGRALVPRVREYLATLATEAEPTVAEGAEGAEEEEADARQE